MFIVKLEDLSEGLCYLASGNGDPPRTMVMENAIRFRLRSAAEKALTEARTWRPFRRAEIISVKTELESMVTIRMSKEQHAFLSKQANKEGVSLNTFCLRQMGLDTPFGQSKKKRGRKLVPQTPETGENHGK